MKAALACVTSLALSVPAQASWVLRHEEDFRTATHWDSEFWRTETGFQRNRELQYYQAASVQVRGGALVIEAQRQTVANEAFSQGARGWRQSRRNAGYTSGSLVSLQPMLYGKVELVARAPTGNGVWPAAWLLHESTSQYGEIDFFEAVGKHPDTVFAAVHHGRTAATRKHHGASKYFQNWDGKWRTHAVEWTPRRIAVTVDGLPLLDFDPADAATSGTDPLRQPMHLRINLALGGSWAGPVNDSRLPARFEIASVRVWSWDPGVTVPNVTVPVEQRPLRWGR